MFAQPDGHWRRRNVEDSRPLKLFSWVSVPHHLTEATTNQTNKQKQSLNLSTVPSSESRQSEKPID